MPPVPKPSHGRSKKKRGQVTTITDKVRKEVDRRSMELWDSDIPLCEKCGYARDLTKAHILNASQGGSGSDPANILNLCGSHGIGGRDGRGGCHDKSDNTAAGRTWKVAQGEKLAEYYRAGEGRKHWKY